MKNLFGCVGMMMAGAALAAPEVSNVRLSQTDAQTVTVTYDMPEEAAVVTVDVLTNGVSMGAMPVDALVGDANALVAAGNDRSFRWRTRKVLSAGDYSSLLLTAKVKAWDVNDLPPYMLIDLKKSNTVRYYPNSELLPGGVGAANPDFRTRYLLMVKAPSCNATYLMGTPFSENRRGAREYPHLVTFTKDFYIGVFELTQGQLGQFVSGRTYTPSGDAIPVNATSYNQMRGTAYSWPGDGHKVAEDSYLGMMRTRCGVELDLPTDAQWEFAYRAGTNSKWYNGDWRNTGAMSIAWYEKTTGATSEKDGEPRAVGGKNPNAWGIYDMAGNVWEWVLDWNKDVLDQDETDPVGPPQGTARVYRGGSYWREWTYCRAGHRNNGQSSYASKEFGFRLACPAVAK